MYCSSACGELVLRQQRLRQAVAMAGIVGIPVHRLLVGLLRFRVILLLRIGVAQQIIDVGRGRIARGFLEQVDGVLRAAFVDQKLAELLKSGSVVGIVLQDAAKHFFGFVVAVLEPIKPRKPQERKRCRPAEFSGWPETARSAFARFSCCAGARARVAERAHVNPRQQTARGDVVRDQL